MQRNIISLSIFTTLLVIGCSGGGSSNSDNNNTNPNNPLNINIPSSKTLMEGNTQVISLPTSNANITFSIIGNDDDSQFKIDPQTAELQFKTAPDYENPADANGDNVYIITIEAKDNDGKTVSKTVNITVTDDPTDNGPEITSANTTQVQENSLLNFTVEAANATSYAIVGGDDKNLFQIDNNGKLSFMNFIPDYEHSSDKNHDNNYEIVIQATDNANHSSTQNFTVAILDDENEASSSNRYVFKTGQNDGPAPAGQAFGDDRNFNAQNGTVVVGDRVWEDSAHSQNTTLSYNQALQYCNQLSYAGIDNWRVPKRHELYEIINYGKSPTIDDIFTNKSTGSYWTNQALVNYNNQSIDNTAFVISFSHAEVYPKDMDSDALVRCVSGPEYTNPPVITKNAEATYKDTTTGLEWAKDAGDSTWQDAKTRCENLTFAGKTDWRLPNINELHTIMPVYNEEFLLDDDNDDYGDLRGPFWASTDADTADKARKIENYWDGDHWAVDEADKDATHTVIGRDVLNDGTQPKTDAYIGSICVRGGHL